MWLKVPGQRLNGPWGMPTVFHMEIGGIFSTIPNIKSFYRHYKWIHIIKSECDLVGMQVVNFAELWAISPQMDEVLSAASHYKHAENWQNTTLKRYDNLFPLHTLTHSTCKAAASYLVVIVIPSLLDHTFVPFLIHWCPTSTFPCMFHFAGAYIHTTSGDNYPLFNWIQHKSRVPQSAQSLQKLVNVWAVLSITAMHH